MSEYIGRVARASMSFLKDFGQYAWQGLVNGNQIGAVTLSWKDKDGKTVTEKGYDSVEICGDKVKITACGESYIRPLDVFTDIRGDEKDIKITPEKK